MKKARGFTLIELMVVLVILSILAMIALPAYSQYARRSNESRAEQQLQNLAMQLDRYKSRQFNYHNFDVAATTPITLPEGVTGNAIKYEIKVKDGGAGNLALTDPSAMGVSWAIKAEARDNSLYSYLITSTGIRCKAKLLSNINYQTCGANGETW